MTFREHLTRAGSICKARREYMRERRWASEDWYHAWQTTTLPAEVTGAIEARREARR